MTTANSNASVQGLGDCFKILASSPQCTDVKAGTVPLWVLVCQEGEAFLDRNPLGRVSDIHGNGEMPRGRWRDGKFTIVLELFNSQDCIPRDSQSRHAERVAASLLQAPEECQDP